MICSQSPFDGLDGDDKVILVTTFQERTTTHERLMEVLDDIHSRDLTLKLDRLVQKDVLNRLGSGRGSYYELVQRKPDYLQESYRTPLVKSAWEKRIEVSAKDCRRGKRERLPKAGGRNGPR